MSFKTESPRLPEFLLDSELTLCGSVILCALSSFYGGASSGSVQEGSGPSFSHGDRVRQNHWKRQCFRRAIKGFVLLRLTNHLSERLPLADKEHRLKSFPV